MKKLLVSALLSAALFGFAACGTAVDENGNKIVKVGFIAPMTGDAAVWGEESQRAASYYLENKVNPELEAKGLKMELVFEDGKCAGADAANAFQKLTDLDGVDVVIGGVCSSETLAAAPLANEKKKLLMSFGSSNPNIQDAGEYVVTFSYSDAVMGEGVAAELKKYNTVAIISEQNDFNVGFVEVVRSELEGTDTTIVADEEFPKGHRDFRNTLEKIKATNPDAIFLNPNIGVTADNLLKQMAEDSDWNDVQLISHVAYLADSARENAPEFAEGMILVDAPKLDDPKLLEMFADIEDTKGSVSTLGNFYVGAAFDDLDVVAQLITEHDGDTEAMKNTLRSEKFTGYTSEEIYFGEGGFNQNLSAATYVITDGVATPQM